MAEVDIEQLNSSQQDSLQQYIAITDQAVRDAIPILQKSEWNVQIAISRFLDGEPAVDLLAEARAAATQIPAPGARQTQNIQFDAFVEDYRRRAQPRQENLVRQVEVPSAITPVWRPPLILAPFIPIINLVYRLASTILSPLSFLVPSVVGRLARNLFIVNSTTTRRQLPPADNARRFIREFEETYPSKLHLPFVEAGFNLTLDSCKRDAKFLLVVLLSPSHDDTSDWIHNSLLSPQFHQFVQTHRAQLELWGGSVQDAEGYQVSKSLNCTKFPFVALICQTSNSSGSIAQTGEMMVTRRVSGAVSAGELVAQLVSALEAQQAQLTAIRASRADRNAEITLRQEQDSAYERSLAQDRERARLRREQAQAEAEAEKQALQQAEEVERLQQQRDAWRKWRASRILAEPDSQDKGASRISLRLVDGQRVIRRFDANAPLEELYAFVECYHLLKDEGLDLQESVKPDNYEHVYDFSLISPLPRAVFDISMGGTISDRIGRSANIVVELIDTGASEDPIRRPSPQSS